MRRITVPAGIGDSVWLIQKLINAGEQFDFILPGGNPRRGKQIFDLIPSLSNSCTYQNGLTYKKLAEGNIQRTKKLWSQIQERSFFLSINEHMEAGIRIEKFFPDLDTSFKINWTTEKYKLNVAVNFPSRFKYIGLYGSSYSTTRAWGFWNEKQWLRLAQLIHKHNPDYVFVIIGAVWDLDLGRNLVKQLYTNGIPFINTIGEPLGAVLEIMKKLTYFFSFPSGLGILAPTINCPVTMFYPDGKKGAPNFTVMMNAWASREDIESGVYKGCLFCEPEQIFKWIIDNKKI